MTYVGFDCGITFSLKILQNLDRSNENRINFPDPVKNPNVFPASSNISALLINSIALISF